MQYIKLSHGYTSEHQMALKLVKIISSCGMIRGNIEWKLCRNFGMNWKSRQIGRGKFKLNVQ